MTELKATEKENKLSQKRIWISSLLGFFIPFTSYLYTQRWKPFLYFAGGIFAVSIAMEVISPTEDMEESFQRGSNLGPLATLIAIGDNWTAIDRARKKQKSDGSEDDSEENA